MNWGNDDRLLAGNSGNEDAAVVRLPGPGSLALVQTVDFFTPIVNDPFRFGQIAAANALSDVYAMGGTPLSAMNIVCFPIKELGGDMLRDILAGGAQKILEAGAVPSGGHSVEDQEPKYGLAVSGLIDRNCIATNSGLRPGDALILTKPLGTGVLATGIKAKWEGFEGFEDLLYTWAGRLNKAGGEVIQALKLKGATDVTGFGLGGHLMEMAHASDVRVRLELARIPFLAPALELAAMGMIPAGSFANKSFCSRAVHTAEGLDPIKTDLVFDAQTSGGLVLATPEPLLERALGMLRDAGEMAEVIGEVLERPEGTARLEIT